MPASSSSMSTSSNGGSGGCRECQLCPENCPMVSGTPLNTLPGYQHDQQRYPLPPVPVAPTRERGRSRMMARNRPHPMENFIENFDFKRNFVKRLSLINHGSRKKVLNLIQSIQNLLKIAKYFCLLLKNVA